MTMPSTVGLIKIIFTRSELASMKFGYSSTLQEPWTFLGRKEEDVRFN